MIDAEHHIAMARQLLRNERAAESRPSRAVIVDQHRVLPLRVGHRRRGNCVGLDVLQRLERRVRAELRGCLYIGSAGRTGAASAGYHTWTGSFRLSAGSLVYGSGRCWSTHSQSYVPMAYGPVGRANTSAGMFAAICCPLSRQGASSADRLKAADNPSRIVAVTLPPCRRRQYGV